MGKLIVAGLLPVYVGLIGLGASLLFCGGPAGCIARYGAPPAALVVVAVVGVILAEVVVLAAAGVFVGATTPFDNEGE